MIRLPLSKPALFAYTPHQGFMLFLDRLEEYSLEKGTLRSVVEITEESVFYDRETRRVPIWTAFEYMAQSVALLAGIDSAERGEKPNIGFIMGIRNFHARVAGFAAGEKVDVSVRQVYRDGDVAVFEGKAEVSGLKPGRGVEAAAGVINTISAGKDLLNKIKGQENGA